MKDIALKVYIQQTTSNLLYSAARGWVTTVLEADAFDSSIEAFNCCIRKNLPNVHIRVNSSSECGYDTIFSVEEFPKRTKASALV